MSQPLTFNTSASPVDIAAEAMENRREELAAQGPDGWNRVDFEKVNEITEKVLVQGALPEKLEGQAFGKKPPSERSAVTPSVSDMKQPQLAKKGVKLVRQQKQQQASVTQVVQVPAKPVVEPSSLLDLKELRGSMGALSLQNKELLEYIRDFRGMVETEFSSVATLIKRQEQEIRALKVELQAVTGNSPDPSANEEARAAFWETESSEQMTTEPYELQSATEQKREQPAVQEIVYQTARPSAPVAEEPFSLASFRDFM